MRLAVTPFAKAADHEITFTCPWQIVHEGTARVLGDFVNEWDYMTRLHLTADLQLDMSAIRHTTHQGGSAKFAVVVSAASNATRLRGPIWSSSIAPGEKQLLKVDTEIGGFELGGRLDLLTTLVLADPDPIDKIGAPAKGAILWQHRHPVALEGDASQFPTESVDLSQPPYRRPRAGWLLEADMEDLDAVAAGAVRLLVNHSHPVMKAVLDGVDSSETALAMHTLRWDIARQLIVLALDSGEFVDRQGSFEEDTLGWTLTNIVRTHFPRETYMSLRAIRDSQPAEFESMLQDASGIFG
jgi:hypothetical protein